MRREEVAESTEPDAPLGASRTLSRPVPGFRTLSLARACTTEANWEMARETGSAGFAAVTAAGSAGSGCSISARALSDTPESKAARATPGSKCGKSASGAAALGSGLALLFAVFADAAAFGPGGPPPSRAIKAFTPAAILVMADSSLSTRELRGSSAAALSAEW